MKATTMIGAGLLLAATSARPAAADEKTVIQSGPDSYTETRKGDDSVYKYQQNGRKSSEVYHGDGVQMKTESNGTKTEQVYQGKDCERKAVENAETGDSKVVAEGNCQ